MKLDDLVFIDSLPSIDLHGYDSDYARIKINEFIKDNYIMGNQNVVIVHGIGSGIIRKTTNEVLHNNKLVIDYKNWPQNVGCTVVQIKMKQ